MLVPLIVVAEAEAAWVAEDVLSSWIDLGVDQIQFSRRFGAFKVNLISYLVEELGCFDGDGGEDSSHGEQD